MTSLLCGLAPLIKNPSYVYDAEHFFGFCLQVFPLARPPLRVDCLALMGNMRQPVKCLSQGHQDLLQSLILKKGALTLFRKKFLKYMNLQR